MEATDLLPALGFLLAYKRFSLLTKHIGLLWFFNKSDVSHHLLLSCIAFDSICIGNGLIAWLVYASAVCTHLAIYYTKNDTIKSVAAYCVALATQDPLLSIDLGLLWWAASAAKERYYQNVIIFLGLRRLCYYEVWTPW